MIAIIDYGVGNLHNLKNALDFQGLDSRFVREPGELAAASHIILPGVGAFAPAMAQLESSGLVPHIRERVAAGVPFLGVCVGMQLLFDESDEGGVHAGLGFIPGRVVRFNPAMGNPPLKIPQIGWNQVLFQREDPLLAGIPDRSYFYFVHSYHAVLAEPADGIGLAEYGEWFPAIVNRGHVWGVQFHPEKSGSTGLQLLRNFVELPSC